MNIDYVQVKTSNELQQILALQKRNLPKAISTSEKQKEGFVTVKHTLEILDKMNKVCPHIIAKHEDHVVAYALCMHPKFTNDIKILKPMFREVDKIISSNETYIVMGQICVDKQYRKKGIFRNLYATMQELVKKEFSSIITEVDAANSRSLQAHYAVGFSHLKTYNSLGQDWKIIKLTSK